jgi:hypothetical protein
LLTLNNNGTVNFNGNGPQNITNPVGETFNNLKITKSADTLTMGNNVRVDDSLTLSSGVFCVNSNTLSLYNSTIFGTTSLLTTSSSSSLFFGGGLSSIVVPSSITTLNSLTIDNTHGAELNGDLTINGTLSLTHGNISLGNNDLSMANTATLSGGSDSSFVYTGGTGGLKWLECTALTTKSFPIGHTDSSACYVPLIITFNAGHTTDDFCVLAMNNVTDDGTRTGTAHTDTVVKTSWNIVETLSGGSNVNLTFQWNGTDEAAGFSRTNCYMAHYNGSSWDHLGSTGSSGGSDPYTFTGSNYTGTFSPFGIGGDGGPLPIKLLYFNAKKVGNDVVMNWATASEQNNDHFTVEKSTSGLDFEDIHQVLAAGFSQQLLKYTYTDKNVGSGKLYYRLRQNDFDGKYTHSSIVAVRTMETSINNGRIYPMPVMDEMYVNFNVADIDLSTILIYDMVGNQVYSEIRMIKEGKNTIKTNALGLSTGMYIVRIKCGSRLIVQKIQIVR